MRDWIKSGTPMVWLNAGALAISLVAVLGLLLLIAARGLVHFWPTEVVQMEYQEPGGTTQHLIGEIRDQELLPASRLISAGVELEAGITEVTRYLVKTGNRDQLGGDFKQVLEVGLVSEWTRPEDLVVLERHEWGNFYGFLVGVKEGENSLNIPDVEQMYEAFQDRLDRVLDIQDEIKDIQQGDIGAINYKIERMRLKQRRYELDGEDTPENLAALDRQRAQEQEAYQKLEERLVALYREVERDSIKMRIADGRVVTIPLSKVVRGYRPNQMNLLQKIGFYLEKIWEFVSDEPREANTEGGIFPAIFGTVMLVLIMSVFVTPFGVVAAVYLREYAKQGPVIRVIRIAVNNLAGVPSIVYGVFGLGFFVYFLGGNIDRLFYPEAMPAPTFGTPGIIWSALTLAILTLPVVIVSTEEGLARIPRAVREGSLALGATKVETLWKIVIPMASPAIMTGLILAVARAAGEVAPLMLVGVVKLAPTLPLDGNMPFIHLDRKFMHLGFHIYDVGFQSPNVEAARPLVYATSFLLVVVIVSLNLTAIRIRNRLREKYRALDH